MDSEISRWAQIVFLDRDQLDAIHNREVWLARRSGPSNTPLFVQKGLATWEALTMISQGIRTAFPDGYWPKEMAASAQSSSMDDFSRSIYPIWAGIKKQDRDAEAKLSVHEVNRPGQVLFECATMHRQDNAIYASGIKPNRQSQDQVSMQEIRRRAARAAGV